MEISDLLIRRDSDNKLNNIFLKPDIKNRLKNVLYEHSKNTVLKEHNLNAARKLLLWGPPGTGKTMTASVLANELSLNMYSVSMGQLFGQYVGQTEKHIELLFNTISNHHAVYLLDEFDSLGADRESAHAHWESRQINVLLTELEKEKSDSLIVCATNFCGKLDKAIYRRFDEIIKYEKPGLSEIESIINNKLIYLKMDFSTSKAKIKEKFSRLISLCHGLGAHDICTICERAAKDAVLNYGAKLEIDYLISSAQNFQTERTFI